MTAGNDVVAVIPARGGSKGVPGKNLARVEGIPLVGRAIRAAQSVRSIDSVYVSTDDDSIAKVAEQFGAQVIRRPDDLSGDTASSESALLHALDEIAAGGALPRHVVFLQATSPFIPGSSLETALSRVKNGDYEVVFSAIPFHGFVWQQTDDLAHGVNHDESVRLRRQDRTPEYLETGAFYVMDVHGFKAAKHRFFGRIGVEIVPSESAIEIDTPTDLDLARASAASVRSDLTRIPVRALVMDFDGVHTDNRAIIGVDGSELVAVNRSDGMGIAHLKAAGIHLLILSKERVPIALRRAEKLGIDALCGIDDKEHHLRTWCRERDLALADVAYIGNDVNDLSCMTIVGWPIAVADAHPEALAVARVVVSSAGGNGAIREVADRILAADSAAT